LSANQLFAWRRLARERNLGGESALPGFIPVLFVPEDSASSASAVSTSQFLLRIWKSGLTHALSARELKVMRRHGPFWLSGRTRIVSRLLGRFFAVV
jgi:transposase-like protein